MIFEIILLTIFPFKVGSSKYQPLARLTGLNIIHSL
jgi:hypothetical protein